MKTALIDCTGFVGTTLQRSVPFDDGFHSTDIAAIEGKSYDLVVGAGAPAKKWLANQKPAEDAAAIDGLIAHLKTVKARTFVLVSTVDVFRSPIAVDENSPVTTEGLQPYGYNRRRLEKFVTEHFERSLIIRLPGLVGPGLKKNIVFDFLNDNNVNRIDSRHVFQFYPMTNLWADIEKSLAAGLTLVHLTAEPVSVAEVAREAFGRDFTQTLAGVTPVHYDFRTVHAGLWGRTGAYQYSREKSLAAIRHYAETEARTL